MSKIKFKFEFSDDPNSLKRIVEIDGYSVQINANNEPIWCWNFEKNEFGILYGDGINRKNHSITKSMVRFENHSDLKNIRDEKLVINEFTNALGDPLSSFYTLSKPWKII